LRVAVEPEKVPEAIGFPFLRRVTPVMALGFPVPETDRINPVMLPEILLGLVNTIC
jgi:hypothetical protein